MMMATPHRSYWVFSLILLCCCQFTQASVELDAYRLIQYENEGQSLGSWRASLNAEMASWRKGPTHFGRKAVVVRMTDLNIDLLDDMLNRASGLVVVMPPCPKEEQSVPSLSTERTGAVCSRSVLEAYPHLRFIEGHLLRRKSNIAVYFVEDKPQLRQLLDDPDSFTPMRQPFMGLFQSKVTLFAKPPMEPVKISSLEGENFYGWIPGKHRGPVTGVLPTLAIVTYYDSFAAAPALSTGANGNGSGLIAALELSRMFHMLSQSFMPSRYNLLFLFTSGSASNFRGLEMWLSRANASLMDSIEFALCLDTIAGDSFNLHLSRVPKVPSGKVFIESLRHAAESNSVQFDMPVKKIKLKDPAVPWQHEWFARSKVVSGTVSSLSTVGSVMQRGSILDNAYSTEQKTHLLANIKVLAEGITRYIYDIPNEASRVFDGVLSPSESFVDAWQKLLLSGPRFCPLLKPKNVIVEQIARTLRSNLREFSRHHFVAAKGGLAFYTDQPVRLRIMTTKTTLFHLMHLMALLAYLLVLFICIRGPRNIDFREIVFSQFRRTLSSKHKLKTR
eukprot:GHVS01065024.1.p1 GENE.GHVS01065024.1~~GHVS01065024.1.p1  ORF type:complete len:560 (+),score=46.90 GHVS01065024.1:23-1702(+)